MGDLFEGYVEEQVRTGAFDEMIAPDAGPRPGYASVHATLAPGELVDLEAKSAALATSFLDRGVTFALSGHEERPFPLDVIPRVIAAEEWDLIERGVSQRVRALEAFLTDVYSEGALFGDGIIPKRVVTTSEHFIRQAHGIRPANGVRVHVAGIDLVRDEAGEYRVLEDNLRTPSGVSYVMENRRAMARVSPDLFAAARVRSVSSYPARLLDALRAAAPPAVSDPTVVMLTPGAYNSAYFEHSLLARNMGTELVEGGDLICRDARVWMRTTAGEQQVDVIYRRIDDEFLDPLHFRPDSVVGCPGLLNAARVGNVTIANMVGNGVADDKLVYTYVPALIRYYLNEDPVLRNVETYRLEDPEQLSYVLSRLDELVLKPVDASGGYGLVIGPAATRRQLERLRREVSAEPRRWIAQPVVALSTAPTLVDGRLAPRHLDLRPFAVNDGQRIWVLPGGLTRVALPAGSLVVNSSQGGGSKDTWVLDGGRDRVSSQDADSLASTPWGGMPVPAGGAVRGPDPGPVYPHGQQQRQQQQSGHGGVSC